jgi:hypothetical protein
MPGDRRIEDILWNVQEVRRYSQGKSHRSRSMIRALHNVQRRVQSEVLRVGRSAKGPGLVSIDFQGRGFQLDHQSFDSMLDTVWKHP